MDYLPCLLRLGGERRGEETDGDHADEFPAVHYWITSSARSSSDCGMVSPSALAVLRLITSSNLVRCSTGKSAGLAPRRILSTKVAALALTGKDWPVSGRGKGA